MFPSSHYVTGRRKVLSAIDQIKLELAAQKEFFVGQMKLIEAQRIEQRTRYDLEMMTEIGYLQRHRELLALSVRAATPASRRPRSSTTCRPNRSCSSTSRT